MKSGDNFDKFYSYGELEPDSDGSIAFGWTSILSIPEGEDIVASYPSKSKRVTEDDVLWSTEEGRSAATLSDYRRYFSALTGSNPKDFLSTWEGKVESLESSQKSSFKGYRDNQGKFLLNLAKLLSGDKDRFSQFGRIYKMIRQGKS